MYTPCRFSAGLLFIHCYNIIILIVYLTNIIRSTHRLNSVVSVMNFMGKYYNLLIHHVLCAYTICKFLQDALVFLQVSIIVFLSENLINSHFFLIVIK